MRTCAYHTHIPLFLNACQVLQRRYLKYFPSDFENETENQVQGPHCIETVELTDQHKPAPGSSTPTASSQTARLSSDSRSPCG